MNAPISYVGAQRTSLLALDFDSTCIVVLIFALHHQSTCFWFQVATVPERPNGSPLAQSKGTPDHYSAIVLW